MKKTALIILAAALAICLAGCGTVYVNPYAGIPNPTAVITMEDGSAMTFVLYPAEAPNTVANFITLANSGYYDGLKIDYVYPAYFLRGGDPDGDGTGGPDYTIDGEFKSNGFLTDGLEHSRGTISMCRLSDDPNSAGSQFFIMISGHMEYDGEYAAFGRIAPEDTASLSTLDALSRVVLDKSYRPLLRQAIASVRVDTKGYVYEVIKHEDETEEE